MWFDPAQAVGNETYKVMSQTVIPRPIAWIVTETEGVVNIAPFSYFIPLSSNPPALLVSIGHKSDGTPKDTLANLRMTKRCTICLAEPHHMQKLHFSSKALPHRESEAELFDIPVVTMKESYPPMIEDVPVAYFCTYMQEVELGGKTVPVIVRADHIYLRDDIVKDEERLHIAYEPLVRIGKDYAVIGEVMHAPIIP
jgi:flavin reductase (DIM6/NTAB) family NADH-FMN oxidoreductase RutF